MRFVIVLNILLFLQEGGAQAIHEKDRYGNKLFFIDDHSLLEEDQYGEELFYWDGRSIRGRDRYGRPLYYFEGIPNKWVLVAVIHFLKN